MLSALNLGSNARREKHAIPRYIAYQNIRRCQKCLRDWRVGVSDRGTRASFNEGLP